MRVEIRGTAEFRATAAKLKAAGDGRLRREMARNMGKAASPVVTAMQNAVKATSSAGVRGGGGQQRREFTLSRSRSRREAVRRRAAAGRGLRSTVARTLKTKVSTGARTARVEIRSNVKLMPADQRKLPRHMNTGRWKHPVFSPDRERWTTQTVTPPGWFDRPARIHGRKVRDQAVDVVRDINRKIAS